MTFMRPEIYKGWAWHVETDCGGEIVPNDAAHVEMFTGGGSDEFIAWREAAIETLQQYCEGTIDDDYEPIAKHGWLGRYQAPGYMDCTPWNLYDTEQEAIDDLNEMYGDEESEAEGAQ